jgi:hypothetical protein
MGALGRAVPPNRPAPGRGRPWTQVEPGSLGSGCPPEPLAATVCQASDPARPDLTAAEWAALQQLADANASVVARWPVGRTVALALIRRNLVHGCSEWVWLTQAGRQTLEASLGRQSISVASLPQPGGTVDQTARPPAGTAGTDRQPARQRQATTAVRRPAGGELPRGIPCARRDSRDPAAYGLSTTHTWLALAACFPGFSCEPSDRCYPPVAEKCIRSVGDRQVPPQVQPMAAKAVVTTSPRRIMPGRAQDRSR